ncbi:MAG: GNAT family N-acetyltransferase [Tissierellia bacterium]|nr:GNAT family N-acetyltransferase [Tissierellia bacterium]
MIKFTTKEDFSRIKKLREEVFIKEQGFKNEFDDIDDIATHLCLKEDDKLIAYLRIYKQEDKYFIGRVIVKREYRNKGYGKKILKEALKRLKGRKVINHSQFDKREFYKKCGFIETNIIDYDESVKHVYLIREEI